MARGLRIVDRLTTLWGDNAGWKEMEGHQPHEANSLRLDSSKARIRLGWHPRWDLETSLNKIVSWYRAYHEGNEMHRTVLEQIESYCRN